MSDERVRRRIATDLERIAEILTKNQIIRDSGPLHRAASICRDYQTDGMWGYDLSNLVFRATNDLTPTPDNVEGIDVELSIKIEGYCSPPDNTDPLSHLVVNVEIHGRYTTEDSSGTEQIRIAWCAWHLDRHICEEGDNPPEFTHPCYHFQLGGHRLVDLYTASPPTNDTFLLLDSPRLPHPPLDGILGVDFVLLNFISSPNLSFREEGNYINLITPRQEEMWLSYANSVAGHWGANAQALPWSPQNIWPPLV